MGKWHRGETPEEKLERIRTYKRRSAERMKSDPQRMAVRRLNRLRNLPAKLARQKQERQTERAKVLERDRLYRELNRETLRENSRRYRERHREEVLAFQKAYRAANPARCREWEKKWRRKNPDNIKDRCHRRRARLAAVTKADCTARISILKQERFCHWCCEFMPPSTATIDHVIPLARGGNHEPDNLVAACGSCNYSRGDKLISEWEWKSAKAA